MTKLADAPAAPWFAGNSDLAARMRNVDWQATPLGPLQAWPQSLRSAVSICLGSRFPMVVLWGPRLTMLYNDAYAPLLGDKHPGALGRSIEDVWSEIAEVIAPLMDSVLQTGEATWIPDGFLALERHGAPEETYFSYSFGPVRIEDGSVGGILAVTMETTQRVVGERRLAFLKAFAEATTGAADAGDVCSRAMAQVGEGTPDILHAALYLRDAAGEDRLVAQTASPGSQAQAQTLTVAIQHDERAERLGTLVVALNPLRPLDEAYREFIAQVGRQIARAIYETVRDEEGRITGIFSEGFDVTARRRAESELKQARQRTDEQRRLYEAILANTPDLAYVFDLSHRFIYANDVLLRMWGKRWDEAIGKTCLELGYEPWHAEMHNREIDHVVETKLTIRGEVPFDGAFGRRMYDYIFVPVYGESGEVIAVAGTTRDVTEMKELEATLRSQADQLREGDRRKDEFLGMLAHELRNPLAPLRNGLAVIRRLASSPETAQIQQVRAMMDRQVAQMVRLIDDLLDVTRISSGKIRIGKQRLALAEVLQAAVETSQPVIDQVGHTLTITQPGHPVFVDADATRLAQVFANLLTNAAKFTAAGGHIQITTELLQAPGEVSITVRDNGEGIPPDMLTRIFEMFVQVDRTLEREKSGLGIGLCLARGLIELHGGRIEARSEGLGKGSAFIVRLPVVAAARSAPEQHSDAALERLAARRVLIADDNVDAADSLAALLELMGSKPRVVHNGLDAVGAAEQFQPELVILDIGMPGLNGYEACAKIKQLPGGAEMVVVALTGWGQDKDRQRAREAGFDGHLVKPVNPDAIRALIAGFKL